MHSLVPLNKITSSIRKEVSCLLYTKYGIKTPVKNWQQVQDRETEFVALHKDVEIRVHWHSDFLNAVYDDGYRVSGQRVYVPDITSRKVDKTDIRDEYHPYHSWYEHGYQHGYKDHAWDSSHEVTPYPDFPDQAAELAYEHGRGDGACQAMQDE